MSKLAQLFAQEIQAKRIEPDRVPPALMQEVEALLEKIPENDGETLEG